MLKVLGRYIKDFFVKDKKTERHTHIPEIDVCDDKSVNKLLISYSGISFVKSIIPDIEDMYSDNNSINNSGFTVKKRSALANELKCWIDLLEKPDMTVTNMIEECNRKISLYQKVLKDGASSALKASEKLERSYRTLDSFFKNAGKDEVKQLRIVNVKKSAITENDEFAKTINRHINKYYDQPSKKESYSMMVIPGGVFRDRNQLMEWAKIAFNNKVLLVTDTELTQEASVTSLDEYASKFVASDSCLQNVVMACNWLVGREADALNDEEMEAGAFYISPAGALAGMMYDESVQMAQGRAGVKYGTVAGAKGVKHDMTISELNVLKDYHMVPMIFSEGRVMAWNNNTLYNGSLDSMQEYPIVRVYEWIKKVLMNYACNVYGENWLKYESPRKLKESIQNFLNPYIGVYFESYKLNEPTQDPVTKVVNLNIDITPMYAAKNFTIKLVTKGTSFNDATINEK